MARNAVQFKKGLSEVEFDGLYGTEKRCRAVVVKLRWQNDCSCPICGGTSHSIDTSRGWLQCTHCRRQTSPTTNTICAATK
jgi:ribosomal protein L37AE/L43A